MTRLAERVAYYSADSTQYRQRRVAKWRELTRPGFFVDQLVEDVSLPRFPPGLADRALDFFEREVVNRARRRDDVLLDHERAHVVGAEKERELSDFPPLRHPRRLNVGDVVEEQ